MRRPLPYSVVAGLAFVAPLAQAQEPALEPAPPPAPSPAPVADKKVEELESKIDEADQRARIAGRKLELAEEAFAAKEKERPAISIDQKGFRVTSADKKYGVAIHGVLQADARVFVNDEHKLTDTFLLRRVRPIVDFTVARIVEARIMPDFGGGQTVLYDAYVDVAPAPELRLRVGKTKIPFGLERLQADSTLYFTERGFPSAIAPTRDVGAYVYGEAFGGWLGYAAGLFGGVPDGALGDVDPDDNKEGVARLYTKPIKGLLIGLAGTLGEKNGTASNPQLAGYKTAGQNTFFSYRADTSAGAPASNTTVAAGVHDRLTAQLAWNAGPFGLLAEYIVTQQRVARGSATRLLEHHAWSTTLAWVVTGEDSSLDDVVVKKSLDPSEGDWGALEVVARYGELRVDRTSFQDFAQDDKSARLARELGFGLNWYPAPAVKVTADYFVTEFRAGQAPLGNRRDLEQAVLVRTQLSF